MSNSASTSLDAGHPPTVLLSSPLPKRKFSFPVNTLHASTLLGADVSILSARRRLSNVSDAVSRKLSNTIGWKPTPIPAPDIIIQGKCLCGQYVRGRLKRAGVYNKKMGLHRMRSFIGTPSVHVVRDVYPALNYLGEELERIHPKLYTNVSRQVSGRSCGGELKSPENAAFLLSTIARDLFRTDITWGKVASLFAISGGLALDCVRQGHPEYIPKLIEGIADVIEDELVAWISENGGWNGLNIHVRPETTEFTAIESTCLAIAGCLGVLVLFYMLKFIAFQIIPRIGFS